MYDAASQALHIFKQLVYEQWTARQKLQMNEFRECEFVMIPRDDVRIDEEIGDEQSFHWQLEMFEKSCCLCGGEKFHILDSNPFPLIFQHQWDAFGGT